MSGASYSTSTRTSPIGVPHEYEYEYDNPALLPAYVRVLVYAGYAGLVHFSVNEYSVFVRPIIRNIKHDGACVYVSLIACLAVHSSVM